MRRARRRRRRRAGAFGFGSRSPDRLYRLRGGERLFGLRLCGGQRPQPGDWPAGDVFDECPRRDVLRQLSAAFGDAHAVVHNELRHADRELPGVRMAFPPPLAFGLDLAAGEVRGAIAGVLEPSHRDGRVDSQASCT